MLTSWIAIVMSQAQSGPPPIVRVPPPPSVRVPVAPPPPPPPPPPSSRPPGTPPRQIGGSIAHSDYPAAAIRLREQGNTTVRLGIAENGRVSSCEITASSGSSILDAATCRLITERFRYRPATFAGTPVAATITRRVAWRLPDDPKIAFAQGRFAWTVAASPAAVTACEVTLTGPSFAQFDDGNCDDMAAAWLVKRDELEPGQPPVRVTHILSLLPQGETLTLPRPPGAPLWENVAELEIDAEGTVTACTTVSERGEVPDYVEAWFVPLCETTLQTRQFHAANDGQPRRARMQSAIYVTVQESGRR